MIMDVGILTMFFWIYQYLPLYGGFLSHVGKPFAKVSRVFHKETPKNMLLFRERQRMVQI